MDKTAKVLWVALVLLLLAVIVMPAGGAGGNSVPSFEGTGCVVILLPLGEVEGKEYFALVAECPMTKKAMK